MSDALTTAQKIQAGVYDLDIIADVLVIGGSLSGIWSALKARELGATVVLVEKGSTGRAGVIAAAGGGGGYIIPGNEEQRAGMLAERHREAFGLDDQAFLEKVYHQSFRCFDRIQEWGYQFKRFGGFNIDTMVFLRRRLKKVGVQLLDHSPALELLRDADGNIAGAAGVQRQLKKTYRVKAGAVILATGGTAFFSGAAGTNGNAGDGYLMAAEAGASLIGMEFNSSYALAPANSTLTKGGMYFQGHSFNEEGERLDPEIPAWFSIPNVVDTILRGGTPYFVLDKIPEEKWDGAYQQTPNFYHYFQRQNINPFNFLWPVTVVMEGSVRGSGGLAINDDCSTNIPGLYAVGDVADKSRLVGAFLAEAGPCLAWCVASGEWAGEKAAAFAKQFAAQAERDVIALGQAGLRPHQTVTEPVNPREVIKQVQDEILPLEKNFYRREAVMQDSVNLLDNLWNESRERLVGKDARSTLKAREAAFLAATGRWIYRAALARKESRGLHRHADYPALDPNQCHHLRVSGLDEICVEPTTVPHPLPV